MRVVHLEFIPDFIGPIISGKKRETRRPMKVQPLKFLYPKLEFEDGTSIYRADYPCPYGEPGDLLIFVPEASPIAFHSGKVVDTVIERLFDFSDANDISQSGFYNEDALIKQWDEIYGETIFASQFNPYIWRIVWQ